MDVQKEIKRIAEAGHYEMSDLLTLVKILRSEDGCPWDQQQTHASIRKCLIEETYEVCEAIDREDQILLREELGDLLFQVVFHAVMAEESGAFSFADVVQDVINKMVIRHPHVFGHLSVEDAEEVPQNWDAIKMETKHQQTPADAMDSVARTLPALMRAQKLAHKIRKYGLCEQSKPLSDRLSFEKSENVGEKLFAVAADCDLLDVDGEKELFDVCEQIVQTASELFETSGNS